MFGAVLRVLTCCACVAVLLPLLLLPLLCCCCCGAVRWRKPPLRLHAIRRVPTSHDARYASN